jgi:hypothetical protein
VSSAGHPRQALYVVVKRQGRMLITSQMTAQGLCAAKIFDSHKVRCTLARQGWETFFFTLYKTSDLGNEIWLQKLTQSGPYEPYVETL